MISSNQSKTLKKTNLRDQSRIKAQILLWSPVKQVISLFLMRHDSNLRLLISFWGQMAMVHKQNPLESVKVWKGIVSLLKGCVLIMQSVGFASKQIKTTIDRWGKKTWAASSPSAPFICHFAQQPDGSRRIQGCCVSYAGLLSAGLLWHGYNTSK